MDFLAFFKLSEPNTRLVFIGVTLLCALSAVSGTFSYLRKRSLFGDVIAHAVLPGIVLAFIIGQSKSYFYLFPGAVISGWVSVFLVEFISNKTKLKGDTAIAIVMSVFYGLGITLLSLVQKNARGQQSGLDHFLFGQVAAISNVDLLLFALVFVIVILLITAHYPMLKVYCFDEEFAHSIGLPTRRLRWVLITTIVATVAVGVQAAGVVLTTALLIIPVATARKLTHRLGMMLLWAMGLALVGGWSGAAISYNYPNMPTGPWMVICMAVILLLVSVLAKGGLVSTWYNARKYQFKIKEENTVKKAFKLADTGGSLAALEHGEQKLLKQKGWLQWNLDHSELTEQGLRKGREVIRKHRLWELYLQKYLELPEDHVHSDAEGVEHLITDEIEAQLLHDLDYPESDPHNKKIPYDKPKQ